MLKLIRTDSSDLDFQNLVRKLDADLAVRDGDLHPFYHQFNKIDHLRYVVVAYEGEVAVGCGAIKEYEPGTMEVKRMFVEPEQRNKGIAKRILGELEKWAKELSASQCILETGKKQPEAIALYIKGGYALIPNYGQYAGIDNSVCYKKKIA